MTRRAKIHLIGLPDHDNVITQTKDGANQWVWVEFVGEIGSPLLMGLARDDFEARHCGANTILQLRDARSIPTAGEHREPNHQADRRGG